MDELILLFCLFGGFALIASLAAEPPRAARRPRLYLGPLLAASTTPSPGGQPNPPDLRALELPVERATEGAAILSLVRYRTLKAIGAVRTPKGSVAQP